MAPQAGSKISPFRTALGHRERSSGAGAPFRQMKKSTAPCCCTEQRAPRALQPVASQLRETARRRVVVQSSVRGRAVAPWQGARGLAPWPGRSSTAPCFSTRTAPEQPGSAWQHGAVLLCRAQRQPERNSPGAVRCPARFSFWALFGPFWPRRAPRGARPPANCMSTQGRGSKQGPVFLSPAPLRPWQGPGRFRKPADAKALF